MPEVADVFRRFGGSYLAAHGAAMLPSHRRAIADIIACRTEALGGQQWCCNDCGALLHVFHSCRNRACPKCHAEQTQAWLEQRREEMLPVPYFHVTVTVPEELRGALRRHQIDGYGALMKAAAEAIIVLARDPRWVGGTVGVLAVLHTWTQRLVFHPHVHCLVTGGGLSEPALAKAGDGATWHPAGKTFLFPKSALATRARARFRDAFARLCPDADLPPHVWQIPWVVHITPWGTAGRARLSRPLRLPHRHHQQPHPGGRRRDRDLSLQGPRRRPPAQGNRVRPRVHPALPPARPAGRLSQGPLLRPVACLAPRTAVQPEECSPAGATRKPTGRTRRTRA